MIRVAARIHPDDYARLMVQAAAHGKAVGEEVREAIGMHCTKGYEMRRTATHKRFCEIRRELAERIGPGLRPGLDDLKACDEAERQLQEAGFPVFPEHTIGFLGWIVRYCNASDWSARLAADEAREGVGREGRG